MDFNDVKISMIAAVDKNGALGYKGELLFHVKEDLKHFKELTYGDTVIMGYNTFLSLNRPSGLPKRLNVVLYNGSDFDEIKKQYPDVIFCQTMEDALSGAFRDAIAESRYHIWLIGGASIYQQFITDVDEIELTVFDIAAEHADVYFPMGALARDFELINTCEAGLSEDGFRVTYLKFQRRKDIAEDGNDN